MEEKIGCSFFFKSKYLLLLSQLTNVIHFHFYKALLLITGSAILHIIIHLSVIQRVLWKKYFIGMEFKLVKHKYSNIAGSGSNQYQSINVKTKYWSEICHRNKAIVYHWEEWPIKMKHCRTYEHIQESYASNHKHNLSILCTSHQDVGTKS